MSLVGKVAPGFELFNQARTAVSLASLRGQKVVLAFYPAAFTGVCEKEMCSFRDHMGKLNAANAVVLGISVDSPFANAAFAKQTGATFSLLSDLDASVVKAYGVAIENFAGVTGYTASNRAVFVVGPEGEITWEWIAPNPGHEPDYAAVLAAVA